MQLRQADPSQWRRLRILKCREIDIVLLAALDLSSTSPSASLPLSCGVPPFSAAASKIVSRQITAYICGRHVKF